jgi:hypothetical protein
MIDTSIREGAAPIHRFLWSVSAEIDRQWSAQWRASSSRARSTSSSSAATGTCRPAASPARVPREGEQSAGRVGAVLAVVQLPADLMPGASRTAGGRRRLGGKANSGLTRGRTRRRMSEVLYMRSERSDQSAKQGRPY